MGHVMVQKSLRTHHSCSGAPPPRLLMPAYCPKVFGVINRYSVWCGNLHQPLLWSLAFRLVTFPPPPSLFLTASRTLARHVNTPSRLNVTQTQHSATQRHSLLVSVRPATCDLRPCDPLDYDSGLRLKLWEDSHTHKTYITYITIGISIIIFLTYSHIHILVPWPF